MKMDLRKLSFAITVIFPLLIISNLLTSCKSQRLGKTMLTNPTAANYNVQLGLGYLEKNDWPRAKEKLLLALQQAPNDLVTLNGMAYYLEKTGDDKQAEFYYRQAIAGFPHSGQGLNNYGAFLCRMGQYQAAEGFFLAAIADQNYLNTAAVYENAGLCALETARYSNAKEYFIKALQHDPTREKSLFELKKLSQMQKNHLKQTSSDAQSTK